MPDIAGIVSYGSFFLVLVLINGIAVLGLNLQWGETGLFNVGVAAFVAIGAYASALLTTPATGAHVGGYALPIAVGWLGAMGASALLSALVGLVTLRLRADYLAITTFGVAVTVGLVTQNAERLTGGTFGVSFIPRPFAELAERPVAFATATLVLVGFVTLLVYLALERLARSPWGRVLRAIREDEIAVASLGKNPVHYRLQAFALGGALMGLSGALHAHFVGYIAPDNYQASLTFQVWTMLIVGGAGSNRGALLGALLVWGLWSVTGLATASLFAAEDQARAAALRIVAIGVLLAGMIVYRPRGLLGPGTGTQPKESTPVSGAADA